MINAQDIRQWVESHLAEDGGFLVDVHVSDGADIRVFVDAPEGMPISRCVSISRMIEDELDRDLYDFSLQVSTPGLDQPLKIRPQYEKNIGRAVAVQQNDGHKVEGTLTEVSDKGIVVEHTEKRRIEGRKAKEWVTDRHELDWDTIATTKVKISFKQ
ncbi:MAG: ribosome assembly cofactor RimP [Flavobacteriales bacterium]|nr:ribosome assembly cofactor RimP [Flavobacteriales bacterium]